MGIRINYQRVAEFFFLVIEMFTEIYNKIIIFLKRKKLFLKWYYLYSIDYILPSARDFAVAVCLFEIKITTILLVNLRFRFEYLTRRETYTRSCTKIKFYLVFDKTNFMFFSGEIIIRARDFVR